MEGHTGLSAKPVARQLQGMGKTQGTSGTVLPALPLLPLSSNPTITLRMLSSPSLSGFHLLLARLPLGLSVLLLPVLSLHLGGEKLYSPGVAAPLS